MGFFYQKYAFYASKEQSEYVYDICGQLVRENNSALDKTFMYEYNNIGNITSVKTYAYTTAANPTGTYTAKTYTYDTACPDKLTKVGSKSIGYNSLGCPTSYDGKTFTWSKGKLTRISRSSTLSGTERYTYTYNAKGQRVKKLYTFFPGQQALADYVTSATTTYTYDNSGRLIREYYVEIYKGNSSSDREFIYLYDESGMVGFNFWRDGVDQGVFYYHRNLQGDVIAIYDTNGVKQAAYSYDAWGNCTATSYGTSGISRINPIRYRGYYYDTETGWYFLNARYYNPEWRRFISPDDTAYLDSENPNGLNLYAYCNNDPINYADPSGHDPEWWQWALFGVGVALVAVAAGMAIIGTGGIAAFGMGALIGSASVGTVGAGIGAAIEYATGGVDGILGGALAGFGIGAIVGFAVGGSIGYYNYHQSILVKNYISQHARNAQDASDIFNSFEGKIKIKTTRRDLVAYRYYDDINASAIGRYLTNAPTANPISDLVLYNNQATKLAKITIYKGTQYLVGKIAGSPVGAIQYFVGDVAWLFIV